MDPVDPDPQHCLAESGFPEPDAGTKQKNHVKPLVLIRSINHALEVVPVRYYTGVVTDPDPKCVFLEPYIWVHSKILRMENCYVDG